MANTVKAEWTGKFPCLCAGEWKLFIDGMDVSEKIPGILKNNPMGTLREYDCFSFTDDWDEEWSSYTDGLDEDEWINANNEWLSEITNDADTKRMIYKAFNELDWRIGSCGGCI